MLWLRKFTALLLVSVGVALLLLPFPESLSGEGSREVVYLQVQPPPFREQDARARFGKAFVAFRYETLRDYPQMLDAVLGLMGDSGTRCVSRSEWNALRADFFPSVGGAGLVYAFRDGLYGVKSVDFVEDASGDELACLTIAMLGAYDNRQWWPMRYLEAADLEDYPALAAQLKRRAAEPLPVNVATDIPPRQWHRFERRLIESDHYYPAFVAFDRLIRGRIQEEAVPWTFDARPWKMAGRVAGALAVLFGLGLGVAAYRSAGVRQGIPIAPAWVALFCDLVLVAGGIFVVALALDTLWVAPLGQSSLLGLSPPWPSSTKITGLHFVSIPALFIALPLLSLFFTSLSCQRVRIDGQGVTSSGAVGSTFLAWADLENIRLREQKNPFAYTVMDFRPLQHVVDLEGANGSVTINEPSSRRRKGAIIRAMQTYIPEAKQDLLGNLAEW
jgi:hypothetical protein